MRQPLNRDEAFRLRALCDRWALDDRACEHLERLLEALADPRAPTSVRDAASALDAHIADSLVGLDLPTVREAARIVDVGSGAGLPGLVLAIAMPSTRVDLLESVRRKCEYAQRTAAVIGLANVRTVCSRAEQWGGGEGAEAYDLVTTRAVEELAIVLEYAAPLLRLDGSLVAWKGGRNREEEEHAAPAAEALGMELVSVEAVRPYEQSRNRHLHLYRKLAPTPSRFPRRPGMARKRPLR